MALSNDWSIRVDNWLNVLKERIVTPLGEVPAQFATTFDHLPAERAARLPFKKATPGMKWGRRWEYGWFRCDVKAPAAPAGKAVVLMVGETPDTGVNESVCFVNRQPVGGLDRWHQHIDLSRLARPGQSVEVMVETYAGQEQTGGPMTFIPPHRPPFKIPTGTLRTFGGIKLGLWNEPAYQLWIDAATLRSLDKVACADSLRQIKIEQALKDASVALDLEAPQEEFDAAIAAARKALAPALAAHNGDTMPEMYCFGHSHIDLAWLWPLAQTYRKSAGTWSTVLTLMARYPEYKFLQSQAQAYQFIRDRYPKLYRRIQQAVRKGQWIADGGMWVEADTNIAGGEALIRQFMYGRRFFAEQFGVDSKVCWLPDVFGYSANLPQLMAGCGLEYFSTQKIYWNLHGGTTFPCDTFTWEGIDGSSVLVHNHRDYNAQATPEWMVSRWRQCVDKGSSERFLVPFGWGDGGGGPTRDHLEMLRRERDLEGCPRTRLATPQELFDELEKAGPPAAKYVGELYFELHRGTFTSQARTKRFNRKSEMALREAELWSALAWATAKAKYPAELLEEAWKDALLNQFHDILPGSSISRVYDDAANLYQTVLARADQATNAARKAIAKAGLGWHGSGRSLPAAMFQSGPGTQAWPRQKTPLPCHPAYTLWNSLSWPRQAMVELPALGCPVDELGPLPVQVIGKGRARRLLVAVSDLPACGCKSIGFANDELVESAALVSANPARGGGAIMENEHLRLRIDDRGQIVELTDKDAARQLVPAGQAMNKLELFRDNPAAWDAWDIDQSYQRCPVKLGPAQSVKVISAGPLEVRVAVTRKIGRGSTLRQEIVLRASSRRVDFVTHIDWHERHRLLKVAFPADLPGATLRSEVQLGHVVRATHRNNEFERQRFEWPAQKWAVLSRNDLGIAVLNDCKYGYDFMTGVLRLTLLRAPVAPDQTADQGGHELTYSLLVHAGPFETGQVVRAAYELNAPVAVTEGQAASGTFLEVLDADGRQPSPAVVVETIKRSEDGQALILRLYESAGGAATAKVKSYLPFESAQECNLTEEPNGKLRVGKGGSIDLSFRPFEIKTLRLE